MCNHNNNNFNQHGRPSDEQQVLDLDPNPPPLLALYRAVDLLNIEDLDLIQTQDLQNRVQTLIDAIHERLPAAAGDV
ncbi:hypothetical protein Bca52824_028855 [Brassica carinata]|uniref:Uncharacterized protein n=1 Tax=Brassica carinata TaxID=52824 RepID=A0A8X7VCX3_BRACI|nr:hypothetical protein Bca52824_028855 [Brassica carinata]